MRGVPCAGIFQREDFSSGGYFQGTFLVKKIFGGNFDDEESARGNFLEISRRNLRGRELSGGIFLGEEHFRREFSGGGGFQEKLGGGGGGIFSHKILHI